ncbi:MAG: PorV/PorQ family protein [Elusimicrobiota bacterium]
MRTAVKCLFYCALLCVFPLKAYSGQDAGLPGEYLYTFSGNARVLGMGRACTALASGSSSPYWNPAGIAPLIFKEGTFLYAPLFEDTAYYFVSVAYPIVYGNVLALSVGGMRVGGIENTDYDTEFSDSQNAYIISYARSIKKLDLGINIKAVHQKIYIYSDTGFGMDIGARYMYRGIIIGACIQNIIRPGIKLKNETDRFPMNLKTGISKSILEGKVTGAIDLDYINMMGANSKFVKCHLGCEYAPYEFIALRAGYDYKEITAGFGLNTPSISMDYAFGVHATGTKHRISVSSRFGLLPTEAQKMINEKQKSADMKLNYADAIESFHAEDYNRADEYVRKTLEADPDHEGAVELKKKIDKAMLSVKARDIYMMAIEEKKRGNEAFASDLIIEAKAIDRLVEIKLEEEFFFSARAFLKNKQYSEAKEALENVIQINPENTDAGDLLIKVDFILQFTE